MTRDPQETPRCGHPIFDVVQANVWRFPSDAPRHARHYVSLLRCAKYGEWCEKIEPSEEPGKYAIR